MIKRKQVARKTKSELQGRRRNLVPERCFFCARRVDPSAEDFAVLEPFLTRRGKIRGKRRSGLCARHQRRLAKEIKKARNLGLLPFKIEG